MNMKFKKINLYTTVRVLFVLLTSALLLSSCGGDDEEAQPGIIETSMTADISGAVNKTFASEYAVLGLYSLSQQNLEISAYNPDGERIDLRLFDYQGPGSYSLGEPQCNCDAKYRPSDNEPSFDTGRATGQVGTVTIEETETTYIGTFSFTAAFGGEEVEVTNGQFVALKP